MKSLPLLFAFAISSFALAQDPAPPADAKPAPAEPAAPKPENASPELPPLPDPSPTGEPANRAKPEPGLVPEGVPAKPAKIREREKGRTTLKPPVTSAELDSRIKFRQAHTRASSEPAIQALWEESRQARTDYEKRDALRRYYTTLYKRIASMDKTILPLVEERQRVSLRRLEQNRIEATDPVEEYLRHRGE
jgi:hypothetical protein